MNTSVNKQKSNYSDIRAQRQAMDPRLQNRQRFVSKEHFPNSNALIKRAINCGLRPMQ